MPKYFPGQRQACREEHGWPIHCMKAEDVFANDVYICRPATGGEGVYTGGVVRLRV